MLYRFAAPALFALDPETAHRLTVAALRLMPKMAPAAAGPLAVRVAGLDFPNPVGIAAGFDKNAEVPDAMLGLGFGFAEVGSITPRPQGGNPRPRLFRLTEDRAVINRMGFNNGGRRGRAGAARDGGRAAGLVGVNVGANKDSADRIADYARRYRQDRACRRLPDGQHQLAQHPGPARPAGRCRACRAALGYRGERRAGDPPVFLKVAPDLGHGRSRADLRAAVDHGIAGLIVANTTMSAAGAAIAPRAHESGGLSGAPLRDLALARLRDFRAATGGEMPLIGVGGIASADDAWERIRAGASLVQLYSAMVYEGPGLARRIVRGLEQIMQREGFASIAEAVGTG